MGNSGDDRRRWQRRTRILDRVVSLRHPAPAPAPADEAPTRQAPPSADELSALHVRLDHLEAALEGLQDAVYRDAQRHARELAELRHEIQPAEMARSLSSEARRRGV
jgi:hypothetical protein